MGEVEAAKDFKPELSEYLILTTAPRDAKLQSLALRWKRLLEVWLHT
jgi:hypothetical protein